MTKNAATGTSAATSRTATTTMAATMTDVPVAAKGWRSWVCTRWTRTWAMMLPSLTGLGQVLSTTDKAVAHDGHFVHKL